MRVDFSIARTTEAKAILQYICSLQKVGMSAITYKWSISEWHELVESGLLADKAVELLWTKFCYFDCW